MYVTTPSKISKYTYQFKPGTIFFSKRANTLQILLNTETTDLRPMIIKTLTLMAFCKNVLPHIRQERQFTTCEYSDKIIIV